MSFSDPHVRGKDWQAVTTFCSSELKSMLSEQIESLSFRIGSPEPPVVIAFEPGDRSIVLTKPTNANVRAKQ